MELFTPIRIGSLEIKNRLVKSATHESMAGPEGEVTGEILERGQRFSAKRLTWSEDDAVITAFDVEMSDPQFVATGATMRIELATGIIEIEEGVRMDI